MTEQQYKNFDDPICSRGIPESDDHFGSDAAGWPDLLHNKVEITTP